MSSAAGPKNYTVYVTDVSGSAVSNISGGWQYWGAVNNIGVPFSSVAVTPMSSDAGFYVHNISILPGTGYVHIEHPPHTVNPKFFLIDDNSQDADSIYGRFLSAQSIQLNPSSIQSNGPYSMRTNTDFEQTMVINASSISSDYGGDGLTLTGWAFTVGSTTPLISGGSVTVVNSTTRTVKVEITRGNFPNSLLGSSAGISPSFDIIGTSPTGKKKAVITFTIVLTLNQDTND